MKKPKDFDIILERIQDAESWRDSSFKEKWERNLKQYHSVPAQERSGYSNIYVPYTFMQCDVIKARVVESLFAESPWVTLFPRGEEDGELAKTFQTLLNWQLSERVKLKKRFSEDIVADAIIFGTTIVYTGWQLKQRVVKSKQKTNVPLMQEDGTYFLDETGMPVIVPMTQVVQSVEAVYDDPIVQKVDIYDFFVDPSAASIQDARYCGHVEYLTKEQIQSLEQTNGWSVEWKNLLPVSTVSGGREERGKVTGANIQDADSTYTKNDRGGLYKVHHYWEDNRHVAIINEQVCAIDEENPFWHGEKPYDKCCYVPNSNEFYGVGIPDILRDLQAELNTNRNMRIDYAAMTLRRMWKVRKDCGLSPNDLVWKQGGVLQVNEMDDVQEILVQNLPSSAFSNEETIKQDMRDATGCHDIVMGLAKYDETATTTMTKDNNASLRFKAFVSALVDDILIPVVKKCVSLDQQFLNEERVVRLVGEDADKILSVTPEDLIGNYDIIYAGTSVEPMANKELYRQKVLETYNLAINNGLVAEAPESQFALLQEVLSAMEFKDTQAILAPLDSVVDFQNQMHQIMQQQELQQATQPQLLPTGGVEQEQIAPDMAPQAQIF